MGLRVGRELRKYMAARRGSSRFAHNPSPTAYFGGDVAGDESHMVDRAVKLHAQHEEGDEQRVVCARAEQGAVFGGALNGRWSAELPHPHARAHEVVAALRPLGCDADVIGVGVELHLERANLALGSAKPSRSYSLSSSLRSRGASEYAARSRRCSTA
eukprot:CAMPEP_0179927364 /NCGR_PEP_ID=MMETSP0983-20121128/8296_1 /TAXON_ID=483367 /ORGANISM="non described non described, Strain CCMP 2436" /LENGTH=157 /DNA_ID=CAMNT_0021831099 /DNA_START=87 /DNA_END=561 /DNA_ORIENTATION=+